MHHPITLETIKHMINMGIITESMYNLHCERYVRGVYKNVNKLFENRSGSELEAERIKQLRF